MSAGTYRSNYRSQLQPNYRSQFPPGGTKINPPTAGLVMWLDASAGILISGGLVATWADQSGNGNDVTNGASGSRPALDTGVINGKPAVNFASGKFLSRATSPVASGSPRSAIFVTDVPPAGTGILFRSASPQMCIGAAVYSDLAASQSSAHAPLDPSPGVYEWYMTVGSLPVLAQNGAAQVMTADFGTGHVTNDSGADGFELAGGGFGSGVCKMAMVLVYDHVLSAGDVTKLRRYLQATFGIVIA